MRHFNIARKAFSILANLSLLLNSFLPFITAIKPAYAQSVEDLSPTPTPVEIVENNPTPTPEIVIVESPTPTPEVTPEVTPEITPEVTPEITPEVTPIVEPTAAPENNPTPEPQNNDNQNNNPPAANEVTPTVLPTITPTPNPVIKEVEQVCLTDTDAIRNSVELDWNYDATKDIYETREKVQLGVKYVFPQDNKVTVTFNCLPKDELLRSTLKIKRAKTSDLKLPNIENVSDYAYDITTDMRDGIFKYDITLPKLSESTAKVSYIEKSIEEATLVPVAASEVKSIENLEQQSDSVKALSVDHFTIFLVSSNIRITGEVNGSSQITVSPGESITVNMEVQLSGGEPNDWLSSRYQIGNGDRTCVDTADHTSAGTYTESFQITAPSTIGTYDLTLRSYDSNGCPSGGDRSELVMQDAIIVSNSVSVVTPVLPNNPSDTYAFTSTSGVWTSVSGGSSVTGTNTNEVRWGTSTGFGQSGLRFDGAGAQSFNEGDTFYLGALTHFNWPIQNPASGATLQITLDFNRPNIANQTFSYDFNINETTNSFPCNSGWQQSSTACDDKITFPVSYGQTSFQIGDKLYTLRINGFVNSYPSGTPISQFITEEQKNNSAYLVGTLSSVLVAAPQISLVQKSVNGDDADSIPGPTLYVGDNANFTYAVQNTGNVTMTGVVVHDSMGVAVSCPKTTLTSGESMTCTGSSTVVTGQYTNTAHVHGTYNSTEYTSNNESANYFGVVREFCGDGVINGSEQCDGSNLGGLSSTDFSCDNSCKLELIEEKVTICHSSSSHSNPYITNQPDKSGDVSGHASDNGPVWYPSITVQWGDIIPPFAYIGGTFPGLNWTSEGQAIYNNGCNLPNGTLKVVKVLVNTGGGNKTTSDFSFTRDGGSTYTNFESDGTNEYTVAPGSYSITEFPDTNYSVNYDQCSGTINAGQTKTCTITNTYTPRCGDTIVNSGEQCDDGNSVNTDSCTNSCQTATCGDGLIWTGNEICDNGAANDTTCSTTYGVVGSCSYCDANLCTIKTLDNPICGDGNIDTNFGEECDGSNGVTSGYTCSDTCRLVRDAGQVTFVKTVDQGPGQPNNWTFAVYDSNGGLLGDTYSHHNTYSIETGSYTVTESNVEGYSFNSASGICSYNPTSKKIEMTVGANGGNCTIANKRDVGSVKVNKKIDLNGDGDWNDSNESSNSYANSHGFSWELDGASRTFGTTISNLATTLSNYYHNFTEYMPANYHFVSWYNPQESGKSCTNPNGTTLPDRIQVNKDKTNEITLCNAVNTGTLKVHKFEDINLNQTQDDGENNLKDWDMNLYSGNNCNSGNYLRDLDTNNSGDANFGTLTAGNYSVKESLKSHWQNSTSLCQNITINRDSVNTLNFGNYRLGSIVIKKQTSPDHSAEIFNYRGTLGEHTFSDNDTDTFDDLQPGSYTITEDQESGWYLQDIVCTGSGSVSKDIPNRSVTISIKPGESNTCEFKNFKLGKIEGNKFNDQNGDGRNHDEPKLNGWQIFIDANKNGVYDDGEKVETTHGQYWWFGWHDLGYYSFENLMPGEYQICEIPQTGWYSTSGTNCRTTTIHENGGDVDDDIDFANRQYGSVLVHKFNDINNDGILNTGENGLSGWTIGLYQGSSCEGQVVLNGSQNSDSNGDVIFTNIIPGVYSVKEEIDSNSTWINTTPTCQSITITSGTQSLVNIGNIQRGSINVTKFNDLNGDGDQDQDEVNLPDWTINLTGQTSVVTNSDGIALFEKLFPGNYDLSEDLQSKTGWTQTNIICDGEQGLDNDNSHQITLTAGQNLNCKIANRQLGKVTVTKFNDLNGNGQKDDGESNLSDWTINLTNQTSQKTNENGQVVFDNLVPGSYDLSEDVQSQNGWKQTNIYCEDSGNGVKITAPGEAYGHHGQCAGWNSCGDAATCALWACEVKGYSNLVSYGDQRPCTQFGNCHLFYSRGSVQYNWGNWCGVMGVTDIVCSNGSGSGDYYNNGNVSGNHITVNPGQNKICYIGNQRLEPKATITKSNNSNGVEINPGGLVEYSINVGFADNSVNNLKVTDLLSNGFKYKAGSYKVYKNGSDVTASITEPEYHSPGVWDLSALGVLTPSDTIKLVYTADISTNQQAGKYADLAWSIANYSYDSSKTVLALAGSEGKVDTNFVGTEVIVGGSYQESVSAEVKQENHTTGEVLGASTELPGTGAATIWLLISGLIGLAGFSLLKFNKKTMLTILLTLLSFGLIISPVRAETSSLSVRLEQPKTPSRIKEIELKYVALDIQGRGVTTYCLKKGPTDGSFVQFSSETLSGVNGNSSHCSLSSTINENGSYQFQVKAIAGGEERLSNIVSLDYNTSSPGTPVDYRKEQINSCDFKIHFKTADDSGKTVKVELYRSTDSNFSANNESLVNSVNIGSNQEKDIWNNVPDCSKTYYFALRAFDSAGNGSGLVGDKVYTTVTDGTTTVTSTTTNTGAIPVNGTIVPKEGEGDQVNPDTSSEEGTGQVLGTKNVEKENFFVKHPLIYLLIFVVALDIIVYVVQEFKKGKKVSSNKKRK